MAHFEKTLSENTIFKGKVFTVKEKQVQLENGSVHRREVVLHNGGASVIPVDDEGNVYMVRQFRSPFECEVLEIPAGKLEPGEDPFAAAQRELKEETGFTAEKYYNLGEMWPTVGYCGEKIYIYLATGLTRGDKDPDEDEFLSTVKIPFDQAVEMCMDGQIVDGKTLVGLLKAKEILKK